MTIKSLTLTAALIAAYFLAAGQNMAIWVGYTLHPFESPSFSEYFSSYNIQNETTLKTPYPETWEPLDGIGWQFSFLSDPVGFQTRVNTGVSYLNSRTASLMRNGDGRQLQLQSTDWTVDLGFGPATKYFYFNLNIGMNLRMAKLRSSFVLSDGTTSYGIDHWQNGVYTAWRPTALLGATLGITIIRGVELVFRADWVPPTQNDDTYKTAFTDDHYFKTNTPITFPRNVDTYVYAPYTTGNDAYYDFTGMRYTIAIQLVTKHDN